jgi:16S rRNA (uracil1498-N3)-methyltransferase
LRRYWIEEKDILGQQALLHGDLFHHIVDVCRQEIGSKFELISNGKAYFVEIVALSKKGATAQIIETRQIPPLPKPDVKLALCVPRFPVLESLLEKAVELGVNEIQLLSSQYSFIKNSEKISENKWERWLKIIKSSTQQCGRGDLMQLSPPIKLLDWSKNLNLKQAKMCLFGYEGPVPLAIGDYFKKASHGDLNEAWILVGGEGGFSQSEVQALEMEGCQAVTLGPQVLRVETACITLTSILKYELDLMRGS